MEPVHARVLLLWPPSSLCLAKMENISSVLDPTQTLRGLFFFFFSDFAILQLLTSFYLSSYTMFSHNDFDLQQIHSLFDRSYLNERMKNEQ